MTLRGFASALELSPVYICNIEKDKRPAPKQIILKKITSILNFSNDEVKELLDLAAKSQGPPAVSYDISTYIMEKDIVRTALRTAQDTDASDEDWKEFIERIM